MAWVKVCVISVVQGEPGWHLISQIVELDLGDDRRSLSNVPFERLHRGF
ncbi:hypothetical protein [Haloferula chungangensis]